MGLFFGGIPFLNQHLGWPPPRLLYFAQIDHPKFFNFLSIGFDPPQNRPPRSLSREPTGGDLAYKRHTGTWGIVSRVTPDWYWLGEVYK